jgi:hypothetical protein
MKKKLATRVSEGTWWEEKNSEEKVLSRATRRTRMHVVFAGAWSWMDVCYNM